MSLVLLRCPNPDCGNGIEFEQAASNKEIAGYVLRCRLCSEVFYHPMQTALSSDTDLIGADILDVCPSDARKREEILLRYGLELAQP